MELYQINKKPSLLPLFSPSQSSEMAIVNSLVCVFQTLFSTYTYINISVCMDTVYTIFKQKDLILCFILQVAFFH